MNYHLQLSNEFERLAQPPGLIIETVLIAIKTHVKKNNRILFTVTAYTTTKNEPNFGRENDDRRRVSYEFALNICSAAFTYARVRTERFSYETRAHVGRAFLVVADTIACEKRTRFSGERRRGHVGEKPGDAGDTESYGLSRVRDDRDEPVGEERTPRTGRTRVRRATGPHCTPYGYNDVGVHARRNAHTPGRR